jgi:predicted nicotinamide N-methyase
MLPKTTLALLIAALLAPSLALSLVAPQPDQMRFALNVDSATLLGGGDPRFPPMVSVPCTGGALTELIKPPNVDALYEWYASVRDEPDADPSWGVLWPTAVSLASYLCRNPATTVEQKRVVELGAGLGLCGLVSAGLGAKSVLLTDREGYALHCAMSTAAVNNLQDKVTASIFDWENNVEGSSMERAADVVLASDVLYDSKTIGLLARACKNILAPGGMLLLTDPVVSRYPHARDTFRSAWEAEVGGTIEEISLPLIECTESETMEGRDHTRRMKEPTVLIKCFLP